MAKRSLVEWRTVEIKERGGVVVQVNELPLPVPRYSFKVGAAFFTDEGEMRVGRYLTLFNVEQAALLLAELGEKYCDKREECKLRREE